MMAQPKQIKPYGEWKSPISSTALVQSSLRLGQLQVNDSRVIWTEGRPSEKGRTALMSTSVEGGIQEISETNWDVRTQAHEYGGGAFLAEDEKVFIIENSDQQIYKIGPGGQRQQLTREANFRYADMNLDSRRTQLYAVGEDHTNPERVVNQLLRIPLQGQGEQLIIAEGHDFYSNPQLSPNGKQISFLTWDHPNMPWDGTELWMADLTLDGDIANLSKIAGGPNESIFQPLWDPNGNLYFVSDRNGWWNIFHYSSGQIRCLLAMEAEFGLPQWVFGMSTYTVLSSGRLIAHYRDLDGSHLTQIDVATGQNIPIETPYSDMDQIHGSGDLIAFIGRSVDQVGAIVSMDLKSNTLNVLQSASEIELSEEYISTPELIRFEPRKNQETFAWYYPPKNSDFLSPPDERPPLIVLSHGGPTTYSAGVLNLVIQYWTTRGFAIADVNYSGSTGFGRAYRERLNGTWGIRDVEDCAFAATHLSEMDLVDANRLIIKGGSAGGYTTLAALTFTDVFKSGASYYGIGDLEMLARDTHKFESRYMDRLVGLYPQEKSTYMERSPIQHTQLMDCPVIFLQGLDDPVVPPNQAEIMVAALKEKQIPVAYVPFEGESHGFRQSTTIVKAIESEFYFYSKIFGIKPADTLEAIEIFNL